MNLKRILIIGGGLSGLTAAYTLEKNKTENVTWDLYEQAETFGGKFETVKRDGFLIEKGPDSFLARKEAGLQLVAELGLTDKLIANATGRSYIFHDGSLHPIPEGSVMGIPTDEKALLASSLLTEAGKERAILEKTLPFDAKNEDISLGEFFEARFGHELVKRLVEPLLSGIYAGNIYEMSLRATFPQFEQAILKAGSLMEGLKTPSDAKMSTTGTKNTIGAFRTLAGGLSELPNELVRKLPKDHLHASKCATAIIKKGESYEVQFSDGTTEEGDAILIAATHDALIKLLDEETTRPFQNRPLTTLATVSLAYDDEKRANLPEGTGYLVARTGNDETTACTWVHKKWPHMVPDGKMLLRGFVGKSGENLVSTKSDDELIHIVLNNYKKMMHLNETPLFAEVSRMEHAMPQYDVGHSLRLSTFRKNLAASYPRVEFAGMSYNGVGIPDCIRSAKESANQLLNEVEMID